MTSKLLTAGSVAPIDEVLTWLIQSTVLLTVGLLAGRFLKGRGPAVQSALYRTILVAVLVCPIASMAIAAMGFPGLVIRVPSMAADDKIEVADRGPDRVGPIARQGSTAIPTSFDRRAIAPSAVEPSDAILSAGTTPEPVESVTGPDWIASMASIVLAFWLLGTAILAMRLLVGHRRMARLRGTAIPAEPEAQALCHELAGRMRLRLPGVLRSPFLSSPCLDGLRRPAILLPEDAEQHLRDTFVHELAHLGRRDGLWNLLRQLATAALWVQPLLWVLSRRIEETAEEVCDDFVVAFGADRGRYAGHLLELAERRLPPLAPSGVGMISLRSLLARRIARILDSTRSLSTRAGRRTITATLAGGSGGDDPRGPSRRRRWKPEPSSRMSRNRGSRRLPAIQAGPFNARQSRHQDRRATGRRQGRSGQGRSSRRPHHGPDRRPGRPAHSGGHGSGRLDPQGQGRRPDALARGRAAGRAAVGGVPAPRGRQGEALRQGGDRCPGPVPHRGPGCREGRHALDRGAHGRPHARCEVVTRRVEPFPARGIHQ